MSVWIKFKADARRNTWKLLIIVIILVVVDFKIQVHKRFQTSTFWQNVTGTPGDEDVEPNRARVKIFDLSRPFEPFYDNITCVGSHILGYGALLCVHNLENDVFVSKSIVREGVWESHVTRN